MMRLLPPAVAAAVAALPLAMAWAQSQPRFAAAPAGDPVAVARRIIGTNFDRSICPRVTRAVRLQGGSIRATCANGETFRVFQIDRQPVALRCSAARRRGIEGC